METLSPESALILAIEKIGSQGAMARLLGISQPAVWKWVNGGKQLPAEFVLAVEAAAGISRHALRPDIYPIETPRASEQSSGAAPAAEANPAAGAEQDHESPSGREGDVPAAVNVPAAAGTNNAEQKSPRSRRADTPAVVPEAAAGVSDARGHRS